MRNPFARLARPDASRPSLRERAASLRASASRVIRRKPVDAAAVPAKASADAGRALAARILVYFGEGPIDPCMNADIEVRDMARALLDGHSAIAPDPILAAIAETRRLQFAVGRASALPQPAGSIDPLPEQTAAMAASNDHIDNVLLKTVPTTAAGCAALARYALDFLEDNDFVLDEDLNNEQHVRILDLIARSPLLTGAPSSSPSVPDFSGYSLWDLMRTYNAFKMATDVMGLTGWTISTEGVGHRLLDAEADRLSHFQTHIADELARQEMLDRIEASHRIDVLVNRAIAEGDYGDAARFAAEADAKGL